MYEDYLDFDDHVLVTHRRDGRSGLNAFIAVHNENRGPAIGGCRMFNYMSTQLAIKDVLRLSRGMTYKNAIADIPYGGGKAVIIADPRANKTQALLHAMGDFVQSLGGRYITSFDSGTTMEDVDTMAARTEFAAGTLKEAGNASDSTANGVYHCMRAAAESVFGSPELTGLTVAVQGVGNVGKRLAEKLAADGALLVIADPNDVNAKAVAEATGARVVDVDKIISAQADILAPCALGGVLSQESIPGLKAKVVVGGANNQLATSADDERLRAAGILYCPDYLANAGGIIDVHYQISGWSPEAVDRHVLRLADAFREVIERADATKLGTAAVTDMLAEDRIFHRSAHI